RGRRARARDRRGPGAGRLRAPHARGLRGRLARPRSRRARARGLRSPRLSRGLLRTARARGGSAAGAPRAMRRRMLHVDPRPETPTADLVREALLDAKELLQAEVELARDELR